MQTPVLGILLAGVLAGFINTMAGGGPIITLFALTLAGVDPRIANLTSTVALLPGQLVTGWSGLRSASQSRRFSHVVLVLVGLGGAAGAAALIMLSSRAFGLAVPWLVAAATVAYLFSPPGSTADDDPGGKGTLPGSVALVLPVLGVYGGFYGGGNSFLLLALFGWAGLVGKAANSAKNLLVAIINGAAAAVFMASGEVAWGYAAVLAVGNLVGSLAALRVLDRIPGRVLRGIVIAAGSLLAAILFWQAYGR